MLDSLLLTLEGSQETSIQVWFFKDKTRISFYNITILLLSVTDILYKKFHEVAYIGTLF